jgi:hypothetical protein
MEEVKEYLGHSSIRVTSDRYGHLFPKARQALAEGLENTFREAASAPPADCLPRTASRGLPPADFSRTEARLVPFPDTADRYV